MVGSPPRQVDAVKVPTRPFIVEGASRQRHAWPQDGAGNQSEGLVVLEDGEWVVLEGGKGAASKAIRFQLRPVPLAR